jgi:hypothetical protein
MAERLAAYGKTPVQNAAQEGPAETNPFLLPPTERAAFYVDIYGEGDNGAGLEITAFRRRCQAHSWLLEI